jgi:alpha-L-arabinofuranosidase
MISRHLGAHRFRSEVSGPAYRPTFDADLEVPFVSALVTGDAGGTRRTVFLLNKHRRRAMRTEIRIEGFLPDSASEATILTGPSGRSTNLAKAEIVPRPFPLNGVGSRFRLDLPPRSLVVVPLRAAP